MPANYDVLIVGGGHNGLTCACYLAAAGLRVRVLEKRHVVGGAAVTEEFLPGFRNSAASYTVSLLHPKVIRELRLAEHGLRIVERPYSNFLPLPDGRHFKFGGGLAQTQAELRRFSARDAECLPSFYRNLELAAELLRALLLRTPPDIAGGPVELLRALTQGSALARLGAAERCDVFGIFTKSAGDLLDAWFESDPIKAVFGFDAAVGSFSGPYASGCAYVLLHHALGEVNGKRGTWGHALGGMGAISAAMEREALRLGVEISTGSAVSRVEVAEGRVVGVVLDDGNRIASPRVAAGINPKLLLLQLVEESALPGDLVRRLKAYRCASGSFRMNVALAELPDFECLPGKAAAPHHSTGIVMAPSLKYMERAYANAVGEGWSQRPIVELLIPSTLDDSLAPRGMHVASLFCQHFNPELPGGASWDEVKERVTDLVIDTVSEYAPNFRRSILGRRAWSPLDLEREYGLVGGDIFHGALTLDQLYSLRPVPGMAGYRTPIRGLYLCGSGAHPGGGVSGIPGHNAAREILKDVKRRRL